MAAMFPKGIRALMVDDDNRFVRSTSTLLSVLNFEVVTCSTVAHALKSLSTLQLKCIDVVLAHAAKAAACGFNFRAIIEADLGIPVIYFLPLDHCATGDEAEELLSTLEAGTYIMPTPLDVDEVRSRLWRVIAWRKCTVDRRPAGGGFQEGEDDEGRVHYKVVKCRKRKGCSSNAGEGSSAAGAGARAAGGRAPPPVGKGKEKVVEGNYQQQSARQKKCRGRKSKKNSGEAFKSPPFQLNFKQPSKSTYASPPVRQPPPRPLFVNSVVKTLKVSTHNAKFFSHSVGPSNTTTTAFAGASSSAAAPPPPRPPLFSAVAPPPPALPPAARHQQQKPPARNLVFGNVAAPVAAAPTVVAATTDEPSPPQQQSVAHKVVFGNMAPPPPAAATTMDVTATGPSRGGRQQLQDARPLLMFGAFGPFPYLGQQPQPNVAPQDMVAPAGGVFTGAMAGGGATAGASTATMVGAYCNEGASSLLQHTSWADPPEHVIFNASQEAAAMESLFNDINNHGPSGSSLVATDDQVLLGMASNVSDPAMAGGEFGSWDATPASFMAPQNLRAELNAGGSGSSNPASSMAPHRDFIGAAPNGGNSNTAMSMETHQNLGAAMDGDAGVMADTLTSDQYGDDDSFPLDALLDGLPSPLLFADLDGGSTAADAAASNFLIGGEEEEECGDINDLEDLNGLEIPHDVFQLDEFLYPPRHKNNKNNSRE